MDLKKADEIINEYDCESAWLVMILQDIQQEYNYLPVPVLEHVATKLGIPLSRVYSVATFYSSLSLAERGRHIIRLCDGTACHLKGFANIRDEVKRHLGIEEGQTTPDKKFTLEMVACLGACALAPVMTINSEYHGNMTAGKIEPMLDQYRNRQKK